MVDGIEFTVFPLNNSDEKCMEEQRCLNKKEQRQKIVAFSFAMLLQGCYRCMPKTA